MFGVHPYPYECSYILRDKEIKDRYDRNSARDKMKCWKNIYKKKNQSVQISLLLNDYLLIFVSWTHLYLLRLSYWMKQDININVC